MPNRGRSKSTRSTSIPFFKKSDLIFEIDGDLPVLHAVFMALQPESDEKKHRGKRCEMQVLLEKGNGRVAKLLVNFHSDDLVSLRASLNSNLRLLASALKTLDTVSGAA